MAKTPRSSALKKDSSKKTLIYALTSLEHDVEQLPKDFEYVIHPYKHLWLSYLRGIFYGLGAITAVAFVVPFILWGMQKVEWVPVIGHFVSQVVAQIRLVQPGR